MKAFQRLLFTTLLCWAFSAANANDLVISSISVSQGASTGGTVTFNVAWNNSWNITSNAPNNWDAVWIFVKFRACNVPAAVPFTHGTLNTTLSSHTIPSTLQAMTSYPQSSYFSAGGSAAITTTLDDANGIMLIPTATGTQLSSSGTVTLAISNLPANTTAITTDVVGIEMVYVPQGPYYLGDGNTGSSTSIDHFCQSASAAPVLMNAATESGNSTYYYWNGSANALVTNLPAAWPKGYNAFYCMKYEITEDLYTLFLNTIGSGAAQNRYLANYNNGNRNLVNQTNSTTFTTTRPYRAQNYMGWGDWQAVLDWSCLRPMTEMEFEKACRGGNNTFANGAMAGEYPWQSTVLPAASYTFSGAETGTETLASTANCNYGNGTFTNGDVGQGPVRAGIFATSATTEQSAGATYYGILDMAGNLREYVIGVNVTVSNDSFTRTVGDGNLSLIAFTNSQGSLVIGDANVGTWTNPYYAFAGGNGQLSVYNFACRGGDWYSCVGCYNGYNPNLGASNGTSLLQTSDRCGSVYSSSYVGNILAPSYPGNGRNSYTGGRGVR